MLQFWWTICYKGVESLIESNKEKLGDIVDDLAVLSLEIVRFSTANTVIGRLVPVLPINRPM